MPSPDDRGDRKANGVSRQIRVYDLTRLDQTVEGQAPGFYRKIKTRLRAKTQSGSDGCFLLALPPGKYSVFVKEKGEWYANSFGGNGEIFEVEVKKGQATDIEFRINHSAFF